MRTIKRLEEIEIPAVGDNENVKFNVVCSSGSFTFHFKWFNDRWNLWVTLPNGVIREVGVYPNVTSWTGHSDYGVHISTDLTVIGFNSLSLIKIYLITWE